MKTLTQRCCNANPSNTPDSRTGRPAVFFDRDGTLIIEKHYLRDPGEVVLFNETIACLKQLQQDGWPLYIITNQAGIARGLFTETILHQVNQELLRQLDPAGIELAGIYYCPHHPAAQLEPYRLDCWGRKPNPGMLLQAAARDHLDLARSYVVGDKLSDIQAGKAVGAKTVLVLTGYGETEQVLTSENTRPDFIAAHLGQAAQWITSDFGKEKR